MNESVTAEGPFAAEDVQHVLDWWLQPNRARWLIYFFSDSQRISDYMAANCTTVTVGGTTREGWRERDHYLPFLGASPPS